MLLPPEAALEAAAAGAPALAPAPAPQPAPAAGANASGASPAAPAGANGGSGEEGAGTSSAGSSSGNATSWRGCFLGQAVMDGGVVETLSGIGSAEACCRRCRQRQLAEAPNSTSSCNAWNWCSPGSGPGGCRRDVPRGGRQ